MNLATVYSTENSNYDMSQTGSNTHSSTSNSDVQTSSSTTSTTTYTPGPLERFFGRFKGGDKQEKKPVE
jgi:hypothetical protein